MPENMFDMSKLDMTDVKGYVAVCNLPDFTKEIWLSVCMRRAVINAEDIAFLYGDDDTELSDEETEKAMSIMDAFMLQFLEEKKADIEAAAQEIVRTVLYNTMRSMLSLMQSPAGPVQ